MGRYIKSFKIITAIALMLTVSSVQSQAQQTDAASQPVVNTINQWAASWSSQNVTEYLNHYSDTFKTPAQMPMEEWRELRHSRLIAPEFINVTMRNMEVEFVSETVVRAFFIQTYRSDRYNSESMKEMTLVASEDGWKIKREMVHREYVLNNNRQRERDGFLIRWAARDHEESMGEAYDMVQNAINSSWSDIKTAYEEITRNNPEFFGELTVQLTINNGRSEVEFLSDSVGSEELRQIIKDQAATWRFDHVAAASFNISLPFKSTLRVSAR